MPSSLPMPIRVAAGLLATGISALRTLPTDLPAVSVTVAGTALRWSLRARQELATLATRGDELLGDITGERSAEPSWARFDEDEEAAPGEPPTGLPDDAGAETAGAAAKQATATVRPVKPAAKRSRPAAKSTRSAATGHRPAGPRPTRQAVTDLGDLSAAEIRDRLEQVDAPGLRALIAAETAGPNRAALVTQLTNRLASLEHEAQ